MADEWHGIDQEWRVIFAPSSQGGLVVSNDDGLGEAEPKPEEDRGGVERRKGEGEESSEDDDDGEDSKYWQEVNRALGEHSEWWEMTDDDDYVRRATISPRPTPLILPCLACAGGGRERSSVDTPLTAAWTWKWSSRVGKGSHSGSGRSTSLTHPA